MNLPAHDTGYSATQHLRQALQERIDQQALELPVLPDVANQVLMLAQEETANAARLAGLIHRDQALAGHLLRIANSPAYLPRIRIVSLQQAVARLGLKTIARIALAVVVKGELFRVEGHEQIVRQLWLHAAASGAWAQEIARTLRHNVETAFLSGLLHEIGKPATLHAIAELESASGIKAGNEHCLALMDEFHARVGELLARKWNLPPPVVESIRCYRDYTAADAFRREALMVHCADHFATVLQADDDAVGTEAGNLPALAELNLYPEDVEALLARREQVEQIVEALS